jgi:hypothetical protein
MYSSFYSVLCFTSVFISGSYEFIYLFMCFLIFFIFGVLKFLECLLYILVSQSSNISMKFSVITCRISSLRMFLWALLGSLALFIFVLVEFRTGYPFCSFPSESSIKLFLGGEWFPSLFHLTIAALGTVQLCS